MAQERVASSEASQHAYELSLQKLKDFVSGAEYGSARHQAMSDYIHARAAKAKVMRLQHELASGEKAAGTPISTADIFTIWFTGVRKSPETMVGTQPKNHPASRVESNLRVAELVYANYITRARIHIDTVPGYIQELRSFHTLTKGFANAYNARYQIGDPVVVTEKVTAVLSDLKATVLPPSASKGH